MPDGKMVFATYSPDEVTILQEDGVMDFTIDIRLGEIRDLACIDGSTMAVSVVDEDNEVGIIDLYKRSITKQIKTKSTVWGKTYNDGSLICCATDKGLIRIDLKDNSITSLVRCSLRPIHMSQQTVTTFITPTKQYIK